MSVSGITNTLTIYQTSSLSPAEQWRDGLDKLAAALDNGNMSSAGIAFNSLKQVQSGLSTTAFSAITGTSNTSGQTALADDLTTLGQALQSGSLANAQAAFSQLQTDLQVNAQNPNAQGVSAYSNSVSAHRHNRSQTGGSDNDSDSSWFAAADFSAADMTVNNSTFSILG